MCALVGQQLQNIVKMPLPASIMEKGKKKLKEGEVKKQIV